MMERLTDDLFTKIFIGLPARSIIRSSCVSKSWNTLISSNRRNLSQPMAGIFYLRHRPSGTAFITTGNPIDTDLSFLPSYKSLEISHICNGLLLLRLRQSDTISHHAVCNPATRSWAMLPQLDENVWVFALGFAPHLSNHYTAIGYSPRRDEPDLKFRVFVSGADDWVDGPEIPNTDDLEVFSTVYLNGIFYILVASSSTPSLHRIIGVDLHGELCSKIQMPCHVPCIFDPIHGLSDGVLHFAAMVDDEMLVWALDDDDYGIDNWVLNHSIHFGAILEKLQNIELFPSFADRPYELASELRLQIFHPDVNVIFLTLRNALLSFDLTSADLEVVYSLPSIRSSGTFIPYSPCYLEDLNL